MSHAVHYTWLFFEIVNLNSVAKITSFYFFSYSPPLNMVYFLFHQYYINYIHPKRPIQKFFMKISIFQHDKLTAETVSLWWTSKSPTFPSLNFYLYSNLSFLQCITCFYTYSRYTFTLSASRRTYIIITSKLHTKNIPNHRIYFKKKLKDWIIIGRRLLKYNKPRIYWYQNKHKFFQIKHYPITAICFKIYQIVRFWRACYKKRTQVTTAQKQKSSVVPINLPNLQQSATVEIV